MNDQASQLLWMTETDIIKRLELKSEACQNNEKIDTILKQWVSWENAKKAPIEMKTIAHLTTDLQKSIKALRPELESKQCYRNATIASQLDPSIKYVEGYVFNGIMVYSHAWNAVDDIHFDITEELVLKPMFPNSELIKSQHVQIVQIDTKELITNIIETGVYGGLKFEQFLKQGIKTTKSKRKTLREKYQFICE